MKLQKNALSGQNSQLFKSLNLTRAEAAVVDLIMSGLPTSRILEETGLTIQGLKFHKSKLYRKFAPNLAKNNVTELASYIRSKGYTLPQEPDQTMLAILETLK